MTSADRSSILSKVVELVLARHVNPADLRRDYGAWKESVEAARTQLVSSSDDEFEHGVQGLLGKLGTSHVGFMRPSNPGMASIFSLNATLGVAKASGESQQWMFEHVLEDGPAHRAGVKPGEFLVELNGSVVAPPVAPLFPLGQTQDLVLESWRSKERRRVTVELPVAAKQNGRPPMIIPKLVLSRVLEGKVGYIRGTYFQGTIGLDFIRAFSAAVERLRGSGAKTFVLDFRGNPGGGLASLRVMSWLIPDRVPVGYSLTRRMIAVGRAKASLPCIDKLPMSKVHQLAMLLKFGVWNRDRSIALATEALGPGPLQNRSVLLFDQNSRSAAEMVAAFVAEHRLAPIVGVKTPGEVLGATNFKLPHGYRLRMPVSTWCTWGDETIEGKGVVPTSEVHLLSEALSEGVDPQLDMARELAVNR